MHDRLATQALNKFIDELVTAFVFTGTTELIEDGDDLELRVHGKELGLLVGPRGTTLQAVQDLARVASQRRLGDHDTRLRVDIGGYRERRGGPRSSSPSRWPTRSRRRALPECWSRCRRPIARSSTTH